MTKKDKTAVHKKARDVRIGGPIAPMIVALECDPTGDNWRVCGVCGRDMKDDYGVVAEAKRTLWDADDFVVCEHCIKDGDVPEKLIKRAKALEDKAADLRNLAGRIVVPSFEDWQRANYRHDAAFCRARGYPVETFEEWIARREKIKEEKEPVDDHTGAM